MSNIIKQLDDIFLMLAYKQALRKGEKSAIFLDNR